MNFPRACGILLHPTSLPGRFGIGDLGDEAFKFVDFLRDAGQTYWQVLPLVPTGYGDSPYSSVSAFAGNQLLIAPDKLVDDGILPPDVRDAAPAFPNKRVDYGAVYEWKTWMLREAFESFISRSDSPLSDEFDTFKRENAWWLDDFCAFRAIKIFHGNRPWHEWPDPVKLRNKDAVTALSSDVEGEIEEERFRQFLFFRQWFALRRYANDNGIRIIGDIPIFVALDSADVWCNQRFFKLHEDGSPTVAAGVPPDYFSKTGQLWGNPIYDWDAMMGDDFGWWTARIAFALKMTDIVRLDHFIGFAKNWEVPARDKTAQNGRWSHVPGNVLFSALRRHLGELSVIAEDLGSLTPDVEEMRDRFGFPGMRILQYGFGGDAKNPHTPHNYVRNSVAYTGTHDNETAAGWYKSASGDGRRLCRKYLRSNGREIHWDMIAAVMSSIADTAILPAQDLLGLKNDARINTPATTRGNWQWRLKEGDLNNDIQNVLREMTGTYGRLNDFSTNAEASALCAGLCTRKRDSKKPQRRQVEI